MREPFRPRVWWSPTAGVIEQVERRWPEEPPRYVRTRDRRVTEIPDDAVELLGALVPAVDVVKTVAAGIKANLGPDHVMGSLVAECYEDFARAAIAAMPKQAVSWEQVEQAALFMFAVRTYTHGRPDYAGKCWEQVIDDDDREAWRRTARDLLAFVGITVEDGERQP